MPLFHAFRHLQLKQRDSGAAPAAASSPMTSPALRSRSSIHSAHFAIYYRWHTYVDHNATLSTIKIIFCFTARERKFISQIFPYRRIFLHFGALLQMGRKYTPRHFSRLLPLLPLASSAYIMTECDPAVSPLA